MRLTSEDIKKALSNKSVCYGSRIVGKQFFSKMCNELIEYKNIEEELGIDSITLLKAMKDGIYVREKDTIKYIQPKYINLNKRAIRIGKNLYFSYRTKGTTWALTKEELK